MAELRDIQLCELEILLEFDRICKKYGLSYFLVSGTLLGAVRHKGFIPWDDDVDIAMPYKDYLKFCKIAKKELGESFFLQNDETDNVDWAFAKIRKNGTTFIETIFQNKKMHHGVWIDIFPLIGVEDNKRFMSKLEKRRLLIKTLVALKNPIESAEKISRLHKLLSYVPQSFYIFFIKILKQITFKSADKCQYCFYLWGETTIRPRFPSSIFSKLGEIEFEGHLFPAPEDYDKYLTIVYGDYMTPPPIDKRNGGKHSVNVIDLNKNYTEYLGE